ncbi:MAG: glycosyltransferase family 39 protein [Bacteroidales bacterium]|nr:glycosyltransferase family 39 protein [Bacteroidales bacterium]
MAKNKKFEFYIPLLLSGIMLIALKVPYLEKPFCYSEAQLLNESIFFLKANGIGTVFNEESVQLPDLYSFVMSFFARYVTAEIFFIHLLTIIFSLLTIFVAYKFGKFFFSIQAGVMAASIVTVQNIFLAQTGLVLPNMMLTCCLLTSLYTFYREKFVLCSIFLTLASLTDIIGFVTAIFILIAYYKTCKNREWKMTTNMLFCIPIALWFIYQITSIIICGKISVRDINFDVMNFVKNLDFIFVKQFRFIITAILIISILINVISKNILIFIVKNILKITWIYIILLFVITSVFTDNESSNLILVTILAIATGCALSTLNISYYMKYTFTCALIVVFAFNTIYEKDYTDSYLSLKDKIQVDQQTISRIKEYTESGQTILCDKYYKMYLEDSRLGYVDLDFKGYDRFKIITKNSDTTSNYDFVIYNPFCPASIMLEVENSANYHNISTISINKYITKIYKGE